MKKYSIQKLATIINTNYGQQNGFIVSVSTDSRKIRQGDCFFAIQGPDFDGHDYVEQAFAKGAACAVVKKNFQIDSKNEKCLLRVNDTIKALGRLAAHYRRDCNFKVIAITGSVGKTTTRHIIAHVLSSRYKVFQAPKNFNNEIGLPLTLLNADIDTEMVVAELGANNPGEIAYLSDIAAADIAVVTNVYPSHLTGLGTLETIIEEKLSIAKGLRKNGKFLISADYDNLLEAAKKKNYTFETFGLTKSCNIKPENFSCLQTHSKFQIDNITVNLPLPGRGNIENAVAAWALCRGFDISAEQFAASVKNLPPLSMRTDIKKFGSITVIDDCYNANPASMRNAIDILSDIAKQQQARAVFICGDMAELGTQAEQLHKNLASDIVSANVKMVLAVGRLAKLAGELAAGLTKGKIETKFFENAGIACNNLDKFIKDNDIVLVKGSRSVALEKVVQRLQELFDKTLISTDVN